MHLNHEFVVPVPVKQAWDVLLDIERIAPCLPGATVDSVEPALDPDQGGGVVGRGDSFAGRVKVKVGPITVTYRGTATFLHRDEEAGRVTIRADGREARGSGTAAATVEAVLHDEGDRTRVTLDTELAITGRPAQFGRGVMVDVSNKLLGTFADCLERTLAEDRPAAAPAAPPSAEPAAEPAVARVVEPAVAPAVEPAVASRPTPDAIDLVSTAGLPVLKRAVPALSALVLLVLVWRVLRRLRS
jgi:carbon monoxide dehydrogenase subunit G